MKQETKWAPITKLENPKATIKTEDWLGKEPSKQKSKIEKGLCEKEYHKNNQNEL